jgi:hypothetical protein
MFLAVIVSIVISSAVPFSTASGQTTDAPRPCEIYTQSDAEALFKESVSPGVLKKESLPAGASCRYSFKKKGGSCGVTVRVSTNETIKEEGVFASTIDVFNRQTKARASSEYASKKYRAVQGLGDDAFWSGTNLWMLKGDLLVIITVHSVLDGSFKNMEEAEKAKEEQELALSRNVAETVLSRMK